VGGVRGGGFNCQLSILEPPPNLPHQGGETLRRKGYSWKFSKLKG
jgi:hypothetical protein